MLIQNSGLESTTDMFEMTISCARIGNNTEQILIVSIKSMKKIKPWTMPTFGHDRFILGLRSDIEKKGRLEYASFCVEKQK